MGIILNLLLFAVIGAKIYLLLRSYYAHALITSVLYRCLLRGTKDPSVWYIYQKHSYHDMLWSITPLELTRWYTDDEIIRLFGTIPDDV